MEASLGKEREKVIKEHKERKMARQTSLEERFPGIYSGSEESFPRLNSGRNGFPAHFLYRNCFAKRLSSRIRRTGRACGTYLQDKKLPDSVFIRKSTSLVLSEEWRSGCVWDKNANLQFFILQIFSPSGKNGRSALIMAG